ncbi:MAG: glycerol-3-phosphate dehydrogenase/oxidase, partial [Candidatus Eisenbacteria bacterium]
MDPNVDPRVDLLVVGGGIHGAAVARDAARRGLSVVLAERGDLAQGTSSRSSKLIHGGIRYLESGQLGLVREALHERAILLRTAPHLVRPLPFVLPYQRGAGRPAWLVRAGLALYDRLAGAGRDEPGVLPRHRHLDADEARALEPGLPAAGLTGAALFHDAQMDDARLVVANAVDAAAAGARVLVRAPVTAFAPAGAGGGWRATFESGESLAARLVINATGPWADTVRALAGRGGPPAIRPTRGSHVVVPALTRGHALLLFAADGRVFFVLPYGTRSLVGTTDVDFPGDPATVAPAAADVRLLRDEIELRWPGRGGPIGRAFAGLRPLLAHGGATPALPWRNTREARILEEAGMLSLVGGKYTTARALAERAVDRAVTLLGAGGRVRACDTATAVLPARPGEMVMPAAATRDPEPALRPDDVRFAVEHEFARGAGDVIWRRSALWLDRAAARAAAP